MGCGCGNKNKAVTSQARVAKVSNAKSAQVSGAVPFKEPSDKVQVMAKKKISNPDCIEMYDQLAILDRKAVALHNKFRYSQIGYRFAETQKIIRGMLIDLKHNCPDEDEFEAVRDFINEEYSKYFSISR